MCIKKDFSCSCTILIVGVAKGFNQSLGWFTYLQIIQPQLPVKVMYSFLSNCTFPFCTHDSFPITIVVSSTRMCARDDFFVRSTYLTFYRMMINNIFHLCSNSDNFRKTLINPSYTSNIPSWLSILKYGHMDSKISSSLGYQSESIFHHYWVYDAKNPFILTRAKSTFYVSWVQFVENDSKQCGMSYYVIPNVNIS